MPIASNRVTSLLDKEGVEFSKLEHQPDFTSAQTAADTFTPPEEFAKTVVLQTDGGPVMAVIAASEKLDLERVKESLDQHNVHLISEEEMEQLFPDCEVGAEPPFGSLYDMPVYISPILAKQEHITFNGGTHSHVIRMLFSDYKRLVQPAPLGIAE